MEAENITIGKLAQLAEVGVETIRFYERKGLIKQPAKRRGFRYYPPEFITRIKFIKRSQELGFTLKESQELLELRVRSQAKCEDVLVKTEAKIQEIDAKIRDLKNMKKYLKKLADCCVNREIPLSECPILECF